jgi:rhamnosyltransferase
MVKKNIGAVIISFNGFKTLKKTVNAVMDQVGQVVIVDNGSCGQTLRILEDLDKFENIKVIYLDNNVGIGAALNIGIKYLDNKNIEWVLTLDQDSIISRNMIHEFISYKARNPHVQMMSPVIQGLDSKVSSDTEVLAVITSGHLVKISLVRFLGGYNEMLFIDGVDFDFCLRAASYRTITTKVKSAYMTHQLGEPSIKKPLLKKFYTNHVPLRRYYMTRNFVYLAVRFFLKFPMFILKLAAIHMFNLLSMCINGPKRFQCFIAVMLGIYDGMRSRFGPCTRDI